MSNAKAVTEATFQSEVLDAEKPVIAVSLVQFWIRSLKSTLPR